MKRKDWLVVALVAVVAGVFSMVLSNAFIASPKNRKEKVEVVDVITNQFLQPDSKYFNAQAVNPTKLIQIGENANTKPFNSSN